MMTSDAQLLKEWRTRRDANAFRELVSRHSGMVYGACLRILRNAADAEEIAQECFLRLAENNPRIRKSLGGWLHTLATHRALDRLKSQKRRELREDAFAQSAGNAVTPEFDEIMTYVDQAIAALPEHLREPIVAHFFENQNHREIADTLGLSRSAVTHRIQRGVAEIRTRLQNKGIALSAAALTTALTQVPAQAAPAALTASLSKLALAGGSGASTTTSALLATPLAKGFAATAMAIAAALGVYAIQPGAVEAPPETSIESNEFVAESTQTSSDSQSVVASQNATRQTEPFTLPSPMINAASPSPTTAPTGATITGVVVDLQGNPVPTAYVQTRGEVYRDSFSGPVNQNGEFRFENVPTEINFYVAAYKRSPDRLSPQVSLHHLEVGVEYALTLTLHEAQISGTVVDAAGKPLPNAALLAQPLAQNDDYYRFGLPTTNADSNGRFTIPGLFAGTYDIKVKPGPDMPGYLETGEQVTVTSDQRVSGLKVIARMPEGLVIAGRVHDAMGNPIFNAHVTAHITEPPYTSIAAQSDAYGQFVLQGLEPRKYRLQIAHGEYTNAHKVDVPAGTEDVSIELQARGAVLAKVIDALTGDPVTHFEVLRRLPSSDEIHWMVSPQFEPVDDPDGQVAFEAVQAGDFEVIVRAKGYAESRVVAKVEPGAVTEGVVVPLETARIIRGRVIDASGNPIVSAKVYAGKLPRHNPYEVRDAARSDADGFFELEDAPASTQLIAAYHPQFAPGWAERAGNEYEVTVQLTQGATVSGVVSLQGVPAQDSSLSYWAIDRMEGPVTVNCDEDGRFRLEHLPSGDIMLTARVPLGRELGDRYLYQTRGFADGAEEELDIDFTLGAAALEGKLTDGGKPTAHLYMHVQYPGPRGFNAYADFHSQLDNTYRIDALPAGPATLRIYPPGAPQSRDALEYDVVLQPGEVTTLDIDM